jgi:hypothetical protein
VGAALERLAAFVDPDARVRAVRVGVFWTVVRTDAGAGLSSTIAWDSCGEPRPAVLAAGALVGQRVGELLARAPVGAAPERALALAALNAGLPAPAPGLQAAAVNGADVLRRLAPGRWVVVVGHFPFTEQLRGVAGALDVFEHPDRLRPGDRPRDELPAFLPRADCVAITATTLLTRTLEPILAACRPDAWTMMVGPSTPLHPLLFELGFDCLAGQVVTDAEAALRCAGEGATLRQMQGLRKVSWLRPGAPGDAEGAP